MRENDGHTTRNSYKDIIQGTFKIDHSRWFSLCAPGRSVAFWIYSNENVDPRTGKGITSEKVYLKQGKVVSREKLPLTLMVTKINLPSKINEFKLDFKVPPKFKTPGAIAVKNNDKHEFFLKSVSLQYKHCADKQLEQEKKVFYFDCKSWVYPQDKTKDKRVFFSSNKFCVPEETLAGIRRLREKELKKLSTSGLTGERNPWDRVYEYDYYNDLGDPDCDRQYARPILGGSAQYPYPRRLKTSRPRCCQDPQSESRLIGGCFDICIPADERMSSRKENELKDNFVDALVRFLTQSHSFQEQDNHLNIFRNILPCLVPKKKTFRSNQESCSLRDIVLDLFNDKGKKEMDAITKKKLKKLVSEDIYNEVLLASSNKKPLEDSQLPSIIAENKDAWADNDEFVHQMFAGTNPVVIRRLKTLNEFPNQIKKKIVQDWSKAEKERWLSMESEEDSSKTASKEEKEIFEEVLRVQIEKFEEEFKQVLDKMNDLPNVHEKISKLRGQGHFHFKEVLLNIVCKNEPHKQESLNLRKVPQELLDVGVRMVVEKALEFHTQQLIDGKQLYILDHHHFLPFLNMVKGEGVCAYATRTLLFDYQPWGIEVNSPNFEGCFLAEEAGTEWELAKAHVAANDSAYHHIVSHWLHTHAVIEPFIIATRRQLSIMHPIHRLLDPHFKDTLHINALARRIFLNAGGILETLLFTGESSMLFSSECYKKWRFDEQALPQDLLKRGMVEEDTGEKNVSEKESKNINKDEEEEDANRAERVAFSAGLKFIFNDYPYAVDGLEIWLAITKWVGAYCQHFYKSDDSIKKDVEIQSWWKEIREEGHGDIKEGWYELSSLKNLTKALTTILWTASGLHAALNFGQYAYAGWPLNRPMLLREFITERKPETIRTADDSEQLRQKTFPDKFQMAFAIAVMDVLSRHTTDEEYLGQVLPTNERNVEHEDVNRLFQQFKEELLKIEQNIIKDNKRSTLSNRSGPAKIPYTLLYPDVNKTNEIFEGLQREGITGKGIPNSVSI